MHVLPDWLEICFNYSGALPRSAVAHPNHQYGISMLVPQRSFQGVTLLVASWNVISKKLTMMQCYCSTPSTLDFWGTSRTDALKLHPITNSVLLFCLEDHDNFYGGVSQDPHPATHSTYWLFFCRFLPFKTIPPLRILCKRSARVGYLFRRENLGREHGLFLAAILQDFLDLKSNTSAEICFYGLTRSVGPMHTSLSHPYDKPWEMLTDHS